MKRAAIVAVIFTAAAAHATTLGELLKAADSNNVDRQISAEQRQKAATELKAAWWSLSPTITAQGGYTYNQYEALLPKRLVDPTADPTATVPLIPHNQLSGALRVDLPLIDTTRWMRTLALAAADEGAGHRDELVHDAVVRQVSTTYYAYAAALAVRESTKRSLATAEEQFKLQDVRFKAGAVTELEVLRARAEVERNKQTLSDSESLVANTRRALRTLTGVDVGEEQIQMPAENVQPEGELQQLEDRTDAVPAVLAAESDAKGAEKVSLAAKLALIPLLTANFTETGSNAVSFTGQKTSYTAGVGLVWRLDVPTFYNMSAQASQAQIANLAVVRQKLASRDQVHTDYQRLRSAIEKVGAAKAQVEAATRAAQVARDRYAAGAATQIDVISADRDQFNAEVNQIQARTELAISHVSLRVSAGLPIEVQ